MTKTSTDTRSIEVTLEIAAPAEDVWRALTSAKELMRWFPIKARVDPGVGGKIWTYWEDNLAGFNTIAVWEPERHLRTGWFDPGHVPVEDQPDTIFYRDVEARSQLVVDYFLEAKGSTTTLRLVHSGFSRDAGWDDEFEGHRRGWTFELRSLRNYLEHHRGKDRYIAWVTRAIRIDDAAAWARLTSKDALLAEGSIEGLAAGERYALTTVHADRLEGEIILNEPPLQFAGTVENLDHSLVRAGIEGCTGERAMWFWVSFWGGDPARAEAVRIRWASKFEQLYGDES